jgi:Ca2+-binding RTX toxin-like protein
MSRKHKPRTRLQIESLENRALLTVTYLSGTVKLDGTNGNDVYRCYEMSVPGITQLVVEEGVGAGKVTKTFDLGVLPVNQISADLKDGNDSLTCDATVQIPVFATGGIGFDTITGGSMADNLSGDNESDQIDGGAGDDTIDGGEDNDTLTGGTGNDTIDCGPGVDRAHGNDGDDVIRGSIGNDFLWGDQGFDDINGGEDDNDHIWGGTENDTLNGASGNDTVLGEAGDDSLLGGQGNDSLNGGTGNDTLDGGDNRDTVVGGDGSDSVDGGAGNDVLSGDGAGSTAPGDDTLGGGPGNDRANGDGGRDTIDGDAGNDTLQGGDGKDTLYGGAGNDSIRGGNASDRIYGGAGDDKMYGENQDDEIFGDAGTDTLDGGTGNDTLVSIDNDTADVLYGRGGKFDSFWVDANGGNTDDIRSPSTDETETNLHYVDSFANGADKTMDGDGIIDPSGGESSNDFAGLPLFSNDGPAVTDINQGDVGDCWLLASLAAAANVTPNVIRQLVVDLGDGTYAVHTHDALLNTDEYFRVDTDLPVFQNNQTELQFAGLGKDDSLWVALVEKAWATDKGNDYQNLESAVFNPFSQVGTPFYPLGQIGGTDRNMYHISDGSSVLNNILAKGLAGTFCTKVNAADVERLVPSHCYAITSVGKDADGDGIPDTVILYNPHGKDEMLLYNPNGTPKLDANGNQERGTADKNDDGFVTLTIDEFIHDAQSPIGALTADFNIFK